MATAPLIVGQPGTFAQEDSVANPHGILPEALPGAGTLLHPAALSAVAGSAKYLLALARSSPGADVGVLSRAMEELERLAAGGTGMDHAHQSTSSSTAADMDIDSAGGSNQLGGGTKRKRKARRTAGDDDASGMSQRPAKRRIIAWRVRVRQYYRSLFSLDKQARRPCQYRSLVAKAKATTRRARSQRAQVRRLESVEQQLARATLSDGLHRWSPGGGGGGGTAEQ